MNKFYYLNIYLTFLYQSIDNINLDWLLDNDTHKIIDPPAPILKNDTVNNSDVKNEKISLSQAINKHELNKTKSTKRTPKPEGDAKKQSTQTELVPPMAEKADKLRFVLDKDIANAKLTIGQDPKSNATK